MAQKTTCPISRAEFRAHAQQVDVKIQGSDLVAAVKEFSTGSLGWYLNGKTTLHVGNESVPVQIGLNLTIVGSKELPQDEAAPASHPAPAPGAGGDHAPPT
jgi:hypothetical protein